jgi:membrane fusion protein, multidrug efflux system
VNSRYLVGLILVIGGAIGAWYWYQNYANSGAEQQAPAAAAQAFATPVEAAIVKQQELVRRIVAVGNLLANEEVILRPEIEGRVEKIHFNEGQQVNKGQLLVSLDDAIYRAELNQADARLALSEANIKRVRELRAKGLSNQQEQDQAVSQLGVDKAAQKLARTRLNYMTLYAPFNGVIGLRGISEGDYLSRGQDIVSIVNSNPIKLEFRVPEVFIAQVHNGQSVNVSVDAYDGESFTGEVYAIAPEIDINGRNFTVRALINNDDTRLKPGLFAQVELVLERKPDALLIPEQALMPAGDKQYVYRIEDGKAVRAEVTTGEREDAMVEITSGLAAGEQIVTAGQMKIMDGSMVQPLPGN